MIVTIEDLEKSKDGVLFFDFEDTPEGIDLKEPAKAKFTVKKLGEGFINVTGTINAKVNVVCDNCLKNFVYEVNTKIDETYAEDSLYDEYKDETEIKDNFFAIDLNGEGKIDLTDLIYQSVILSLPNKFVCDINCNGSEVINKYIKTELQDPRLEIFKTIKTEKDN
ncbi:DUF177 domain-containing protein [bacterium]|nr:DUF177 domain-containing protein [bacterium]